MQHNGGILIRSIEAPESNLICGLSLCVDYLLEKTNAQNIPALDALIAKRTAWDSNKILHLENLKYRYGQFTRYNQKN